MTLAALLETPEPEAKPAAEPVGENRGSPRPRYTAFATLLGRLMVTRGMNASQLARAVWGETTDSRGYKVARNRDRIGHYLLGASFPEEENLRKLANALGHPYEDLAATRPVLRPASYAASTTANFGPRRNTLTNADVLISLLAHEPRYAVVEIKQRRMRVTTASKIFALLQADDENGDAPTNPD